MHKITRLADGQAEFLIVRYCCAARDSFFLRCVDPVTSELGALKHEEMVAKMPAGVLKLPAEPPENDKKEKRARSASGVKESERAAQAA